MKRSISLAVVFVLGLTSPLLVAADKNAGSKNTQQKQGSVFTSEYTWDDCVKEYIEESRYTPDEAYKACDAKR